MKLMPLQDQLFGEFNTLSVMFDKPSKEFISQRVPYILNNESNFCGAGIVAILLRVKEVVTLVPLVI